MASRSKFLDIHSLIYCLQNDEMWVGVLRVRDLSLHDVCPFLLGWQISQLWT